MGLALLFAVAGYLAGSFPTALLVARRLGHDPTAEGSGNPGASNVYRVAGRTAGLAVFAGDIGKGAFITGLAYLVGGRDIAFVAGAAAVVGHTLPPWGHRGGRGVATATGLLAVLFPIVTVGAVALWLAVVRLFDKASMASLLVTIGFPPAVAAIGRPGTEVAAVAGLSAFVVIRHAPNIVRLVRGEERSLRQ